LKAYFDGGTYESLVNASGNSKLINIKEAYIGAGGLNVDLSHQTELDGPTTYWFLIQQKFMSDPALGGTPDGGITFFGAGTGSIWDGFDDSTFTGPIRLRDGARFIPARRLAAPFAVEAAPTARLHDYEGTCVIKDLTLGVAGSSDPVALELRRDVKGYGFVVTNALSVLSPVAITTHNDTHDLSPYPVDGTYTALVYRAELPDVDLSLFTLTAADAQTATISAQQVTVADGGDWDGMKAVVVTIAGVGGAGAANGNVWTSATAGGDWSDTANWANAAAGVPNGPMKTAIFNPATKAGVGVTLDVPVTLGSLTLDASGAKYGYTLLWVIVASNLMAMLIQTLSAKLGIATGRNLAEVCRDRSAPSVRRHNLIAAAFPRVVRSVAADDLHVADGNAVFDYLGSDFGGKVTLFLHGVQRAGTRVNRKPVFLRKNSQPLTVVNMLVSDENSAY
jgi:hypothetical protein